METEQPVRPSGAPRQNSSTGTDLKQAGSSIGNMNDTDENGRNDGNNDNDHSNDSENNNLSGDGENGKSGVSQDDEDNEENLHFDKYGFIADDDFHQSFHLSAKIAEARKETDIERTRKWIKMMKKWNRLSTSKLKSRIRKGVPEAARGYSWSHLVVTPEVKKRYPSVADLDSRELDPTVSEEVSCVCYDGIIAEGWFIRLTGTFIGPFLAIFYFVLTEVSGTTAITIRFFLTSYPRTWAITAEAESCAPRKM
jgi:hypothetical protein